MQQTFFGQPPDQFTEEEFEKRKRFEVFYTDPRIPHAAMRLLPGEFTPTRIVDAGAGENGVWRLVAKEYWSSAWLIGVDARTLSPVSGFDDWHAPVDFLVFDQPCDLVVSNPPFSRAKDFLLHAHDLLSPGGFVVMLLRAAFANGVDRYDTLYTQGYQPWLEARLVHRPVFMGTNSDNKTEYAVFYWKKCSTERLLPTWLDWKRGNNVSSLAN